jgi:hypothetical protein
VISVSAPSSSSITPAAIYTIVSAFNSRVSGISVIISHRFTWSRHRSSGKSIGQTLHFFYFRLLSVTTQQLSRSHSRFQCKMSLFVVFCYMFRLIEPSSGNIYCHWMRIQITILPSVVHLIHI